MSNYLPIYIALSVLMTDAVLEVAFVGSMVGFLHDRAGKFFTINAPDGTFDLHGKPKGLLVDQGHTSNGAAGTALVLVGWLGLIAIWHDKRRTRKTQATNHSGLFVFWVVLTVLSAMLTLAALIYTFILTAQTDDQTINLTVAAANPEPGFYPLQNWTPENWFVAVLDLPLANDNDRSKIRAMLHLMRGWRYNLIPLFIIGVVVASLAVWELVRGGKWRHGDSKEKFRDSTQSRPRSY